MPRDSAACLRLVSCKDVKKADIGRVIAQACVHVCGPRPFWLQHFPTCRVFARSSPTAPRTSDHRTYQTSPRQVHVMPLGSRPWASCSPRLPSKYITMALCSHTHNAVVAHLLAVLGRWVGGIKKRTPRLFARASDHFFGNMTLSH